VAGRHYHRKLWSASATAVSSAPRALLLVALLGTQACLLSFDHYPEADVCQVNRDAGIDPKTAPDPVLRGCDAGLATSEESGDNGDNGDSGDSLAGASGMGGRE
jgi:hypothetical protein